MQLTRFTDLGVRVLMYLATQQSDAPVTSAELATQLAAPLNHMVKVVHRLSKLGWVDAQRGRHGGLRLGVHAAELRLGTVLRTLEESESLVNCDDPPCVLRGLCAVRSALDEGLKAFYQSLDKYTLADLCKKRTGAALIQLHRKFVSH